MCPSKTNDDPKSSACPGQHCTDKASDDASGERKEAHIRAAAAGSSLGERVTPSTQTETNTHVLLSFSVKAAVARSDQTV